MKESLCSYEKGREKAIRTEIKKYIYVYEATMLVEKM